MQFALNTIRCLQYVKNTLLKNLIIFNWLTKEDK